VYVRDSSAFGEGSGECSVPEKLEGLMTVNRYGLGNSSTPPLSA
jgi:hypothetical protein